MLEGNIVLPFRQMPYFRMHAEAQEFIFRSFPSNNYSLSFYGNGALRFERVVLVLSWLLSFFGLHQHLIAQAEIPSTRYEAIAWLEEERNTVIQNDLGEVTEIILDYVPDVFVVGDLEIFPKLEALKVNYTGQFYDRHMSGIARLTSLKKFSVDYCEEISEASLSVLRYLPNLEEVRLQNCEAVYSLKALSDCQALKRIDISSNEHLDFHALKSLLQLPKLESLVLNNNPGLEDKHIRWLGEMKHLTEVRISDCAEITDDGLKQLASLSKLKILDISDNAELTGETLDSIDGVALEDLDASNCGLTDETLAKLAHFKSLKRFEIEGNEGIKGAGLSVIGNFRRLEELVLSRLSVTNEQLRSLDGIDSLKTIRLNQCVLVSGIGLKALTGSQSVQRLELSGCRRIDDDDLVEICRFVNLKQLDLSGTRIKPTGILQLKRLTKLEELNLSACNWIDDEAIKTVAELPAIRKLILRKVPRLTDASLRYLAGLESLESLSIEGNWNITGEGFAAFPGSAQLKSIELNDLKRLSVKGLTSLRRLNALDDLSIYADKISNPQLDALRGIPGLREIDISGEFDYETYRQLIDSLPSLNREDY